MADGSAPASVDVLVVGDGLAGMAAVLEAVAAGATVALVSAGEGSSERAQGGLAAAVGESDSAELHATDTLSAGAGLCDPEAVRALTAEGGSAATWLSRQGVVFDERDGGLALGLEAAHSQARILHADGDASGAAIVSALRHRLQELSTGRLLRSRGWLSSLLLDHHGVAGAVFNGPAGAPYSVRAAATILATGGYGGLYPRTTTAASCDGTALVAALAAGAALADLEFVQFHPTVYAGPGDPFLLTEALRGAGAHLIDADHRRFLTAYDERGELAPRSVVARAITEHLRKTGQPHVLLDARQLGGGLLESEFPSFVARCRRRGLDPVRQAVPVAPAVHYTMGGIVTDLGGKTDLPGLWAAGECARSGVHGANRLASNSLLEAVVFGRRAGRTAAAEAAVGGGRDHPLPGIDSASADAGPHREGRGIALSAVRRRLGASAGLFRSRRTLQGGADQLATTHGDSRRAEAARQLAWLVLACALAREESRGAHVRADFLEESPAWAGFQLVARRGSTGTALETQKR